MNEKTGCPTGQVKTRGICIPEGTPIPEKVLNPPYSGDARYFIDHQKKRIIPAVVRPSGKGWYHIRVGRYGEKTRNPGASIRSILHEHYPGFHDAQGLFADMNYHSSKNSGTPGKIGTYGTHDYNKDFSLYRPLGKYKLETPVKTENKKDFGKEIDTVTLHEWDYTVIDWIPGENKDDPIKLQVRRKIDNPVTGTDKTIFTSQTLPLSKKDEAYKIFNEQIEKAKRRKT